MGMSVVLCNCPIAERVDEVCLRQSGLVGFENLDSWADPLESVSAHQAQTAATCWKSFFVNKHDLGSLPAWLVSDNCFAAAAVATYLDMACIRCGVHLIALPLRHLFWPPVTRGKPNQQHVQPKEPRLVIPMGKVRQIGKHIFYNNEDNREAWHKGEKRTGLTGELAAKWSSFFLCLSESSSPGSWSPDTWKFVLIW